MMMLFKDRSEVTLRSLIIKSRENPKLPEYMIQRVARMILKELEALHSKGYVYCYLNPANILLFPSETVGEPFDLKLLVPHEDSMRLEYMSPESLHHLEPCGLIDSALDIYSLGCVVCEMFGGLSELDRSAEFYEWYLIKVEISPVAEDFLDRCHGMHQEKALFLDKSSDLVRATVAELLDHPFITQQLPLPPTSH